MPALHGLFHKVVTGNPFNFKTKEELRVYYFIIYEKLTSTPNVQNVTIILNGIMMEGEDETLRKERFKNAKG